MADNPFSAFFAGQAGPPRIARPGSVSAFAGVPTAEQFGAAERQFLRQQESEAARAKQQAIELALRGVAEIKRKQPNAAPNAVFQQLINQPTFMDAVTQIPTADDIFELVDVVAKATMAPPPPREILSEGQAVVDPRTGEMIGSPVPRQHAPRVLPEGGRLVDPSGRVLTEAEFGPGEPSPDALDETFFQESGKRLAANVDELLDDGVKAQTDLAMISRLEEMGDRIGTGGGAALTSLLGSFGIELGPQTSLVQAYQSLIDRLVPQQRQGLPGAASDRDVAMFRNSLPQLINQPGGNRIILSTMRDLAQHRVRVAETAARVFEDGRRHLTPRQAIREILNMKDPLAGFKQSLRQLTPAPRSDTSRRGAPVAGAPTLGALVPDDSGQLYRYLGGDPNDPRNWQAAGVPPAGGRQ